jgi:hypothetical protein
MSNISRFSYCLIVAFLALAFSGCSSYPLPHLEPVKAEDPAISGGKAAQLKEITRKLDENWTKQQDVRTQIALETLEQRGTDLLGKSTRDTVDLSEVAMHSANINHDYKVLEHLKKERETLIQEQGLIEKQSSGCFPPGTMVRMGDGSHLRFAQIKPGDSVMTYDISNERTVARTVMAIYQVEGNHLYTINGALRTTGGERLLTQDGWKEISTLKVGDLIHVGGEMKPVTSVSLHYQEIPLINMQVADTHNFYVSFDDGSAFLVHNSGGGGK